MMNFVISCWQERPNERPTFDNILQFLRNLDYHLGDYLRAWMKWLDAPLGHPVYVLLTSTHREVAGQAVTRSSVTAGGQGAEASATNHERTNATGLSVRRKGRRFLDVLFKTIFNTKK
mmetsp:Transcript_19108/g.37973  ORF Transcript_19108/g.37973 Transcript_19108/m.37973 type:complete len:118 (+) Transcript_19108:825-1178(+)